jgi:hypothetical protein
LGDAVLPARVLKKAGWAAGAMLQGPHARDEMRRNRSAVNDGGTPSVTFFVTNSLMRRAKKFFHAPPRKMPCAAAFGAALENDS